MNEINELKKKIFSKKKDYDLIEEWHYLMMNYGYIPFDDFLSMDAGIKNKLIVFLNKFNEKKRKR